MTAFNNYKLNLKLTHRYSREKINFLDLKVKFKNGSLVASVYIKPNDWHQYRH